MSGLDILFVIGGLVTGWILGRGYLIYEIVKLNRKVIYYKGEFKRPILSTLQKIPLLKTEHENNNIYLYYEQDDSFACQEKSLEKLAKKFFDVTKQERAIVRDRDELYLFTKGELLKFDMEDDES